MEWQMDTVILLKLGIAALLGLLLGIEREMKKKPVGVKTSIVISVTACLLTVVSIEASHIYAEAYSKPMDPLRLAAQIVSGIGFLGAGVILRRSNEAISGLTTAAIIWAAAGLGITVGAGFYIEAVLGVLIIIVAVELLPVILGWVGPKSMNRKQLKINIRVNEQADMTTLVKELKKSELFVKNIRVKDIDADTILMQIGVMVDRKRYITDIYQDIKQLDGVMSVEVEGQ